MLDFGISIGLLGMIVLGVGALTFAVATQLFGEVRFGAEWAIVAIAAFAGGFVASEWIVEWRAFEPVFDGLALVPALIGGVVTGVVAAVATRYLTHGTYVGHTA